MSKLNRIFDKEATIFEWTVKEFLTVLVSESDICEKFKFRGTDFEIKGYGGKASFSSKKSKFMFFRMSVSFATKQPKDQPKYGIVFITEWAVEKTDGTLYSIKKDTTKVHEILVFEDGKKVICADVGGVFALSDICANDGSVRFFCVIHCEQNLGQDVKPLYAAHLQHLLSKAIDKTRQYKQDLSRNTSQTTSIVPVDPTSENGKDIHASNLHAVVAIKLKGKELYVDESVFPNQTPELKSIISTGPENDSFIDMSDTSPETFKIFWSYLFTGKIPKNSSSILKALTEIAAKFGLKDLKLKCVKQLTKMLSINSVCDALRVSLSHDEKDLLEISKEYFINNALEILDTEDFKKFQLEDLEFANELIKKSINSK